MIHRIDFPRVLVLAFVSASLANTSHGAILLSENFEGLAMQPFQSPTESNGDGTDWSPALPAGWIMTFNGPLGNPIEFQGWRALDVDSWIATEGDQGRVTWSRALVGQRDTALIADPDAYDDGTEVDTALFNTWITTPIMDLGALVPNSVSIEFDSFWQNEVTQIGTLDVSFDGGATYPVNLLTYDSNVLGVDQLIDERPLINVNNPGAGNLVFRFGMTNASNDWWWAIDDVIINGTRIPEPGSAVMAAAGMLLVCGRRRRA